MDKGTTSDQQLPACSVVIPTRQRLRSLRGCLQAVAASDYPTHRIEVIVVDDGGCGGSALEDTVRQLRGRLEVHVQKTPGVGPAGARNVGAKEAAGEVLAFTDDDCRVDSAWIRTLCATIGTSARMAAGGQTLNGLRDNRWSAASQQIVDLVYAYYNANPARAAFLTTNNLAVTKEAFRDVGGFDERYRTAEDRDFCRRWIASGHAMNYVPEALVFHEHELTIAGFWRQHFGYGRGAFRFLLGSAGRRQLRVVRGFYASIPRLVSALGNNHGGGRARRAGLVGALALWQAANIAGFAWEAARSAVSSVK
ncbi:MAG TPA: glycosyltransferase [Bryobacteraceae bacterium]|nr:glycosyltransferase [Bryobacteraceae bacterium]